MTPSSPDPVAEPSEYQRMLLSYLGQDDPAQAQAEMRARIRALIEEAGDVLRAAPAPDEWSVLECLGHVVDAEIVTSARYRWIVAHDRPTLVPYDQDLWVERLGHRDADPQELLGLFDSLRMANLTLWHSSSKAVRARIGMHEERGPESYDLLFRLLAGHDRFHFEQARRTLESARAEADGAGAVSGAAGS